MHIHISRIARDTSELVSLRFIEDLVAIAQSLKNQWRKTVRIANIPVASLDHVEIEGFSVSRASESFSSRNLFASLGEMSTNPPGFSLLA